MKWLCLLILFLPRAQALECKAPAVLKQADTGHQSMLSWCEVNGAKEGPFEQFSVKNGLEVRGRYSEGKLNGPFKRFYPDGKVEAEGEFKDGAMNGPWTRHYENGQVKDQGAWLEDHPAGEWKYFDEKGKLQSQNTYDEKGTLTSTVKPQEKPLRTSERWLYRLAFTHEENDGHFKHFDGPQAGVDFRLFTAYIIRMGLGARLLPQYYPKKDQNTYSGQFTLNFDLFPRWLDPFAFTLRLGPVWEGFDQTNLSANLALRYQWADKRPGFQLNGAYLEFAGLISGGHNNNNGQNCTGMGPCGPVDNNSGGNWYTAGLIFTL